MNNIYLQEGLSSKCSKSTSDEIKKIWKHMMMIHDEDDTHEKIQATTVYLSSWEHVCFGAEAAQWSSTLN